MKTAAMIVCGILGAALLAPAARGGGDAGAGR